MMDGSATMLPSVVFRVALLAVLRSKRLEGATIGVMITASHNPEPVSVSCDSECTGPAHTIQDNGVKLVDPSGAMLDQTWESHATTLANCPSTSSLLSTFQTLATHLRVDLSAPASIVYARDTRPSGPGLVEALEAGLKAFGSEVKVIDLGVTTTPVLHYVVKATNDRTGEYGRPDVEGYMEKMAASFKTLVVGNTGYVLLRLT
jgi:phosphoacetylglucosamine mutase